MTETKICEISAEDILVEEKIKKEFENINDSFLNPENGYYIDDIGLDGGLEYAYISPRHKDVVIEVLKEGSEETDQNKIIIYASSMCIEKTDEVTMRVLYDYNDDNITIANINIKKLVFYNTPLIQAIY